LADTSTLRTGGAAEAEAKGGDQRILFFDDEVMIIEMVEAMLPSLGYWSSFQNGADALAELSRNANHYHFYHHRLHHAAQEWRPTGGGSANYSTWNAGDHNNRFQQWFERAAV